MDLGPIEPRMNACNTASGYTERVDSLLTFTSSYESIVSSSGTGCSEPSRDTCPCRYSLLLRRVHWLCRFARLECPDLASL